MLEHLYELGYADMEHWIENELDGHIEAMGADACSKEELPPVEFTCQNSGMSWYNEVLKKVPVDWFDVIKHAFYAGEHGAKSLRLKSFRLGKSMGLKSFALKSPTSDDSSDKLKL